MSHVVHHGWLVHLCNEGLQDAWQINDSCPQSRMTFSPLWWRITKGVVNRWFMSSVTADSFTHVMGWGRRGEGSPCPQSCGTAGCETAERSSLLLELFPQLPAVAVHPLRSLRLLGQQLDHVPLQPLQLLLQCTDHPHLTVTIIIAIPLIHLHLLSQITAKVFLSLVFYNSVYALHQKERERQSERANETVCVWGECVRVWTSASVCVCVWFYVCMRVLLVLFCKVLRAVLVKMRHSINLSYYYLHYTHHHHHRHVDAIFPCLFIPSTKP